MSNLSETQTLLIKVVSNQENMSKTISEIRDVIKDYPVTKSDVERHNNYHSMHFDSIGQIKSDISKAKGWSACIGFVSGFLATLIGFKVK